MRIGKKVIKRFSIFKFSVFQIVLSRNREARNNWRRRKSAWSEPRARTDQRRPRAGSSLGFWLNNSPELMYFLYNSLLKTISSSLILSQKISGIFEIFQLPLLIYIALPDSHYLFIYSISLYFTRISIDKLHNYSLKNWRNCF